ncbi:DUF2924 domain-containing protein [Aquisediminimonas sediminicola]|uniref:DUF2924 domain-containing protein n=1 Tax=Alteraquisediminimonas sediminicola TaxID=2676787 RepID=UPI001C8E2562|nr:DUF2924 domain-containing protein [Aquisediminimonas sediminicola]
MSLLDQQLAALANMTPTQLRDKWFQTFNFMAPDVGKKMLALGIAYRLQEQLLGGLSSPHSRELTRLEMRFAKTGTVNVDRAATLKVGTLLVREWQGKTHQILIQDEGYLYQDQVFGSLSQVARHITGTHWSGPRFFGLTGKGRVYG